MNSYNGVNYINLQLGKQYAVIFQLSFATFNNFVFNA